LVTRSIRAQTVAHGPAMPVSTSRSGYGCRYQPRLAFPYKLNIFLLPKNISFIKYTWRFRSTFIMAIDSDLKTTCSDFMQKRLESELWNAIQISFFQFFGADMVVDINRLRNSITPQLFDVFPLHTSITHLGCEEMSASMWRASVL